MSLSELSKNVFPISNNNYLSSERFLQLSFSVKNSFEIMVSADLGVEMRHKNLTLGVFHMFLVVEQIASAQLIYDKLDLERINYFLANHPSDASNEIRSQLDNIMFWWLPLLV